ncbi:helix-turn-helix domain-containing protein (plasmid) [Streptosporangium sp. CA-135522]|uniref:MmyB family transcriptional regulator n=1 Tax=Streptosporangium sp. CA-135522 TaxID=3240072 RepID=UPI003D8D3296
MSSVQRPSFGDYLRHLRRSTTPPGFDPGEPQASREPLSRAKLAVAAEVGMTYLTRLEQGRADNPGREVVDRLADALDVNEVVRQHMHDLVAYTHADSVQSNTSVPEPELTSEERQQVDWLHPHLAGWVDSAWWVQYGNREYCRIYRHLAEVGNVLTWFFAVPESRKIMVEWEIEARLTVAWLRTNMVRRIHDPAFGRAFEELSRFPEFVRMWNRREILMGRHSPHMRVRDLDNDIELTLLANVYPHPDPTRSVQQYVGIKKPDGDAPGRR